MVITNVRRNALVCFSENALVIAQKKPGKNRPSNNNNTIQFPLQMSYQADMVQVAGGCPDSNEYYYK